MDFTIDGVKVYGLAVVQSSRFKCSKFKEDAGAFKSFKPFNRCAPFKSFRNSRTRMETSTFREFSKRRNVRDSRPD